MLSFPLSVSIVIIVYLGVWKNKLIGIDSVWEIIWEGTVGKLSNDSAFLMSVSACVNPTTSYMHCTFVLYSWVNLTCGGIFLHQNREFRSLCRDT